MLEYSLASLIDAPRFNAIIGRWTFSSNFLLRNRRFCLKHNDISDPKDQYLELQKKHYTYRKANKTRESGNDNRVRYQFPFDFRNSFTLISS